MRTAEGQPPAGIQPPDVMPEETSATTRPSQQTEKVEQSKKMLSTQSGNQKVAGVTAEEADLLRRSTKKTKRGARERDEETVQMEEDGVATQMQESQNINEERTEETMPAECDGAPASEADTTTETRKGPTWKAGEGSAENQGSSRPLGDKYGSWMIAQRKPRNYQNNGDPKRNSGKTTGGRNDNGKGKGGGNYGSNTGSFNKAGFTIWNNSRYGALENLEEHYEEEAQEELNGLDRLEGPSSALLSGKGKRPQAGTGDHHHDPPDDDKDHDTGGTGDPMTDVVYDEGQTSAGLEVVEQ
nr:uncharacterized protein LOC109158743 [Ipomoea batatas]